MNPTTRFSHLAANYAANRPAYGDEVIDFVLDGLGRSPRIVDLGAGTGISSRLLAARGADVIALEPNAAMRENAAAHERVRFVDATAERSGLPDASVDAATAFTAFHWFAADAALAEIRRVVRPGGRAVLAVNERDERDPFTAAYGDLHRRYKTDETEALRMRAIDIFRQLPGPVVEREFPNEQTVDRTGLHGRTGSSSYLPREGDAARALYRELDELFDRFATAGVLRIALRTIVVRVDLP